MKQKQEILIGWDNGNGTSIVSAQAGRKLYRGYFPSVYGLGRKGYAAVNNVVDGGPKEIDPTYNGNADEFKTNVNGTLVWGGQSAYLTRTKPSNPSGFARYLDNDYMSYMYHLTLQSLINDDMPLAKHNHIYMTVGMPPKIFYEMEDERNTIMDMFKRGLMPGSGKHSAKFCIDDVEYKFYVDDLTFTAEGTGGYYNALLTDDLRPNVEAARYPKDGVLIVDVGRFTFDTFILVDNQIGEEMVNSDSDHGIDLFFQIVKDNLGGANLTTSDIERHQYNESSRIRELRDASYSDIYSASLNQYLNKLQTELVYYSRYTNRFTDVLVMGGIEHFLDDTRLFDRTFGIDGTHNVKYLGGEANAEGYRKFASIVKKGA